MKRISFIYIIPFICAFVTGTILYRALLNSDFIIKDIKLEIEFDAFQQGKMQLFIADDGQFKSDIVRSYEILAPVKNDVVDFELPIPDKPGRIRIDPGFTEGKWIIKKITLKGFSKNINFSVDSIFKKFQPTNDIKLYKITDDKSGIFVESNGPDPNIISTFSIKDYLEELDTKPSIYWFPFVLSLCIGFFIYFIINKKLKSFVDIEIESNHILILLFIVLLAMPFLGMTLFPSNASSGENRKLHEQPVFSFNKVIDYPKSFDKYFGDNFGFRKDLSTLNSYYKLKFFKTSSKPDLVAVGKRSWLYSTNPDNAGDYQNRFFYTDAELSTIRHNLEEALDWHNARYASFFVMVLPVKSNIYPENLPDFIKRKNENSKLIQLRDYMNKYSRVKIIDVSEELKKAKNQEEVYYQHDFHWNFQGGFIGYTKLINEIKKVYPVIQPVTESLYRKQLDHTHNADLSKILSLENVLLNDEWGLKKILKTKAKTIDPPGYKTVSPLQATVRTQLENSNMPKAVVYRDSYFNLMMPYFSENFSDCIYLWTNELSAEVVEKEKPDVVVYEMLESGIDKFLEDNPTGIRK